MKVLKNVAKHVDLINCCIIGIMFVIFYNDMLTYAIWCFMAIYVWVGWIPLIYGIVRVVNFRKSAKDAVLSIINILSIPGYGLILLINYASQST